jgi:DNA-binding MarR family transcriptional regulator
MNTYVPLVQKFAARVVLFHSAVAAKLGLPVSDLKCLRILGQGSMTPSVLREEIGLSGPAMTALLDRLEKAGYVVRERSSKDRREVFVRSVPMRIREIDRQYDGQYEQMSELFAKYSASEFAAIADFLEQTAAILAEEQIRL